MNFSDQWSVALRLCAHNPERSAALRGFLPGDPGFPEAVAYAFEVWPMTRRDGLRVGAFFFGSLFHPETRAGLLERDCDNWTGWSGWRQRADALGVL